MAESLSARRAGIRHLRSAHLQSERDARGAAGRRHHGKQVGLGDDAPRRRHADAPRRPPRVRHRVGPPHAGMDGRVRRRGRGARTRGDHRRGGRGGAPAGDGRGPHAPARARGARRDPRAQGSRLAAVDRPDARRRSRGHAGHRGRRRDQRGPPRRGHRLRAAPAIRAALREFREEQTRRVRQDSLP